MTRAATQAERFDHALDLRKHDSGETVTAGSATSYLILHELLGCGASPSSWLVLRCWYADNEQDELFRGCRSDAATYLRTHWVDPDPRAERNATVAEPLRSIINSFSAGVGR